MQFAKMLRELRLEHNLTQEQLASQFNKTNSAVRMWETRGTEPDFETLCQLAQFFDVTVGQLLGVEDYF
jgi:transcriptional regulator with XRE-family HTH domain